MLTKDIDKLVSISEEPFAQDCIIGFNSNFVFTNFKLEFLPLIKYTRGITLPIIWLIPVAIAAPNTPILNTYINK